MSVTAKVICASKSERGEGDKRQVLVTFAPDYVDGRNKEWSLFAPSLSQSMTLKGVAPNKFEPRKAYTLTFEPSDE